MKRWISLLSLFSFLLVKVALAASLFGAEFTFTNDTIFSAGMRERGIVNIDEAVEAQAKLRDKFTQGCLKAKKCILETLTNSYDVEVFRVTFPEQNGFWVQIATDPSVVEIQTKPSTAEELAKAKPILDDLFKSAKDVGITPSNHGAGGGHIHMDFASTFGKDAKLFRNFLVDFMNHQEFGGNGVFGGYTSNAPHLSMLDEKQKVEFRKVIEEFDKGKIKTARELSEAVNKRVYIKGTVDWNPPQKYQSLNLTRMANADGKSTVEFRAMHPQRNPEEFLKQLKLYEARVEYLRRLPGNVQLLELKGLDSRQKIASFRSYVEESGMKWEDYRSLVRNNQHIATADLAPLSRVRVLASTQAHVTQNLVTGDYISTDAKPIPPAACESTFRRLWSYLSRQP